MIIQPSYSTLFNPLYAKWTPIALSKIISLSHFFFNFSSAYLSRIMWFKLTPIGDINSLSFSQSSSVSDATDSRCNSMYEPALTWPHFFFKSWRPNRFSSVLKQCICSEPSRFVVIAHCFIERYICAVSSCPEFVQSRQLKRKQVVFRHSDNLLSVQAQTDAVVHKPGIEIKSNPNYHLPILGR